VREDKSTSNDAVPLGSRENIEPMRDVTTSVTKNTRNIRHAVRQGAPLRRKITHKQANINPRFTAAKLYHI
jgi:hypothetical protein